MFPLSELPSRAPAGLTGAERIDPYFGGMFAQGTNATWMNPAIAAAQRDAGLTMPPKWMLADRDESLARFMEPAKWATKLALLGYLGSWRTMTVQQAAAFAGAPGLAARDAAIIRDAFAAHMIDVGFLHSGAATTGDAHLARLLRPAYSQVVAKKVLPHLTYPERVFVTGGGEYTTSRQYDRHNVLSTELGLRCAEYLGVSGVLGETYSTADLLLGWVQSSAVNARPGKSGDLTVVRGDGLRLVVELTATAARSIEAKTRAWATAMSGSTINTDGVFLLYVIAPPLGSTGQSATAMVREVRRSIARVCKQYDGLPGARLADRIAVVRWDEWFPSMHTATDDFLSMKAHAPRIDLGGSVTWEQVALLDLFDGPAFDPTYPDDMTALIANGAAIASSPGFVRADAVAPALWRKPMSDFGFDHEPVPPPYRKDRSYPGREGQRRGGGARLHKLPTRLAPQ